MSRRTTAGVDEPAPGASMTNSISAEVSLTAFDWVTDAIDASHDLIRLRTVVAARSAKSLMPAVRIQAKLTSTAARLTCSSTRAGSPLNLMAAAAVVCPTATVPHDGNVVCLQARSE